MFFSYAYCKYKKAQKCDVSIYSDDGEKTWKYTNPTHTEQSHKETVQPEVENTLLFRNEIVQGCKVPYAKNSDIYQNAAHNDKYKFCILMPKY